VATAEKITVERVVTEEGFVLKLTVDEAETLVTVLSRVGGNPIFSPRGKTEGVLSALIEAGAPNYWPNKPGRPSGLAEGTVQFRDYPEEA